MSTLLLETLLNAPSSSPGGKDYEVTMRGDSGQYEVRIAFGPSGRLGQSSTKYMGQDRNAAQKTFDAAVKAKLKGSGSSVYSIVHQKDHSGDVAKAFMHEAPKPTKPAKTKSPFDCQNLSVIDDEETFKAMLRTGDYIIQAKADGERLSILREYDKPSKTGAVSFFNKANVQSKVEIRADHEVMGELMMVLEAIGQPKSIFFDGEIVGKTYYVFDLLGDCVGNDITHLSYLERFKVLEAMIAPSFEHLQIVPTVLPSEGFDAQWDFYQKIKAAKGEGVVLHNIHSPHEPGKGKNHWKFKFKERSTCIVSSIGSNGLRSVGLQLFSVANSWADELSLIDVGNVTIPVNHPMPNPGDLVDVEYLYKYFDGAFIQPIYKGVRTDVLKDECNLSQVRRYKTEMPIEDMV